MTKHETREFIEQNLALEIEYKIQKVVLKLVFKAADIYESDKVISTVQIEASDFKGYDD